MLVLVMISGSVVSGTFAKFVTEVTGTGTAVVAKWVAVLGDGDDELEDEFVIDLSDTMVSNNAIADGLIAPGAKGSFILEYDTKGTQVDRTLSIVIKKEEVSDDIGLRFYTLEDDGDGGVKEVDIIFEGDDEDELVVFNENIAHATYVNDEWVDPANASGSITVYWEWAYFVDALTDLADTDVGEEADGTVETIFTVTFTATQDQG